MSGLPSASKLAAGINDVTPEMTPLFGLPRNGPFRNFTVRVSHYWPALGGTNCWPGNWIKDTQHPMGGVCRSKLLGEPWSSWAGVGAACPPSVKLRQRIWVDKLKRSYYCVDRGGAIADLPDGTSFVDLLIPAPVWWPDADIITDKYCPAGCMTSMAWVLE